MEGKFKVTRSVETGYHYGWSLLLTAWSRVVLFGQYGREDRGAWKITQYDMQSGKELNGAELTETERPHGMAEVVLEDKTCVALCYWRRKKIVFYDLEDLEKVILIHEVAPHRPLIMCTLAPSILLYINQNSSPREVHWLDCSINPPKPLMGPNVTHKQQKNIGPLCCVEKDDKELMIATDGNGKDNDILNAYVRKSNSIKWSVESILPGMEKNMIPGALLSDGHDNVFILDRGNDCVHMMSVDGLYFGVIVRGMVEGMGELKEISWSEKTSSLIVAHLKSDIWVLTNVKFGENLEDEDVVDANVEKDVKDENENEKEGEKKNEGEKGNIKDEMGEGKSEIQLDTIDENEEEIDEKGKSSEEIKNETNESKQIVDGEKDVKIEDMRTKDNIEQNDQVKEDEKVKEKVAIEENPNKKELENTEVNEVVNKGKSDENVASENKNIGVSEEKEKEAKEENNNEMDKDESVELETEEKGGSAESDC